MPLFLGDPLEFPPIAESTPGEVIWRNPAPLARTAGVRAWISGILPREDTEGSFRAVGVSVPLRFGLPLFCTSEIPAVARAAGVDSVLAAALVAAESGFNPRAVSITGARGLTQLTSRTARSLGVYNRHWPRWNLWGGLTYLAQMRRLFGDDELALAAYNVGPGTVKRKGRAVLREPAVAAYVSSISRLKSAYATRYPSRCVQGGNGIAVAYGTDGDHSVGLLGWGLDVQAFFEIGAGWLLWQEDDSTRSDVLAGTRIYLMDPLLVAGTYHWDDKTWELGALLALQGERVLLGCERDRFARVSASIKCALPLGFWVEARAREHGLALSATIETRWWSLGFSHVSVTSESEHASEFTRRSVYLSVGRRPSL